MKRGNWNEISNKIDSDISIIFDGIDISVLSDYEKRKIIFEYMCNNFSYDFSLLDSIKKAKEEKIPFGRDLHDELISVIYEKNGICNAISQYYKLLLERVGVASRCVVCDDGTNVNHQLNLVYDKENDGYSFDDVTSVIVNRGTIDVFFDYDIEFANSVSQGNKEVMEDLFWVNMPDNNINYLVGRDFIDEEDNFNIPGNIESIKKKKINNVF